MIKQEEKISVFICGRGATANLAKIQLEIPQRILDGYKDKAKESQYTAKQIMENMLINWIDGVSEK